ncbi:MAG: hypothetical protein H0W82_05465 [Actinobacteria bacterium]|nr:hypothetical protein [Actinomycetota bacterium]
MIPDEDLGGTERPVPIFTGDDAHRLRLFCADVLLGAAIAAVVVWSIGRIVGWWA